MERPRLFISAASEELVTARRAVAATVRTLGFDPVSQDDFPTGHGELRQWLREQINACEGLVQIVGQGYGAEPPEVDADYGRVSYTQFEFLYARLQGKKTWVIIAGEECHRDKPLEQIDLPRDPAHPDPAGYQAERQKLQQDYVARLRKENHLRHHAASDTELENVVLRLRDGLGELRERWVEWLKQDAEFKTHTIAHLSELADAARLTTEKIRAQLLHTAETTHHRELAEAEQATDWKERQRLCEMAKDAHMVRLSRTNELAASFAEIEGRGTATSIFQEMTHTLAEQGVDEAIAYVASQRSTILQTVRARTAGAQERNRPDLQPLLKAAALQDSEGHSEEARSLYTDVLTAEPDWPDALLAFCLFLVKQGTRARLNVWFIELKWHLYTSVAQRYLKKDSITHSNLAASFRDRVREVLDAAWCDFNEAYRLGLRLTNGDLIWEGELLVAYCQLGDVALAKVQLDYAARFYGSGLSLGNKAVVANPGNPQWQRNLWVTHEKFGDVAGAQGNLNAAALAYRDALVFAKQLAASDLSNSEWQHDLSVSHDRLGSIARAQDKLDDAARAYGDGLTVRKKLAAGDSSNTQWQRDLYVSYWRLADLAERRNQAVEARGYWKQAFDVLSAIEKRGLHLSPNDRQALEQLRQKAAAAP